MPPEIPISPWRRRSLDRLEALHARGFWPFVFGAYLRFLIAVFCLTALVELWRSYRGDQELTVPAVAVDVLLGLALFLALTVLAWFLTPGFLRAARRSPDSTPRQKEATVITLIGFLILAAPWPVLGLPTARTEPVAENLLLALTYAWLVGIVVMAWGIASLLYARKTDRFWGLRNRYARGAIWVLWPAWFALAALTGVGLAMHLAHQGDYLAPFAWRLKSLLHF